MKKIISMIILAIITIGSVSALIGHMYPEKIQSGEQENILVTFFNHGSSKVKNIRASVYIPDLDVYGKSHSFSVRKHTSGRVYVEVETDVDVKPDFYPAIVRVRNNDGYRETRHTWIEVYN